MDKNNIIGLAIIASIVIGFSFYMQPTEQDIKKLQQVEDSIKNARLNANNAPLASTTIAKTDSNASTVLADSNALFKTQAAKSTYTLENELMKISISNVGGKVASVELKKFKTHNGQPLVLFEGDSNKFGFSFFNNNRPINTNDISFVAQPNATNTALELRAEVAPGKYIAYIYSLEKDKYLLDFKINNVGMNEVFPANTSYLNLEWKNTLLQTEKDLKQERQNATIYYRFTNEETDYLAPTADKKESITTAVKWVAFKSHFFSSILLAKDKFDDAEITSSTDYMASGIKTLDANLSIPYNHKPTESFEMQFYFGPNHFNTLESYNSGFEKIINLGWGPLKYINRYAVIPTFNFLNSFNLNYGLIILLLTILLKVALLPLTYRSYMSAAQMKVLQPEIAELKEKYGNEPTKMQQESMKLYQRAGVNPLAGCIPLVLQMPILIAFFNFFPASFELRQQAFLWVQDLSTYDSVWSFGTIPLISSIYGDHVSLMCLLMTISTILYTYRNNQVSGAAAEMKWIGYIMPIVFMSVLNNVAAGLNFYYFCANMITFAQQGVIKRFVNEDDLHRKIQENKKKTPKKSGFMARMEDAAKQRGVKLPNQK